MAEHGGMAAADETCWTMVNEAARGVDTARENFSITYLPIVRAFLGARWQRGPLSGLVDDAVQDVFMDCLREGGALGRLDPERSGRFRSWLFAVVRNVALRYEERRARQGQREPQQPEEGPELKADEATCSIAFDRAWAQTLIRGAVLRQKELARSEARKRRVELLRLRFQEGLPIREIAQRWDREASWVHHQYAEAREEFKEALRAEVIHHGGRSPAEVERECAEILQRL